MSRSTNLQVAPEVWFRILHLARVGHSGAPLADYREQTVEFSLGPKGASYRLKEKLKAGIVQRHEPKD